MNKFTRLFIADNCVSSSLSVMLDAITTFYLLKNGLTLSMISLSFSLSLIITTFLEFPSGVIADRLGRKKVYAIGLIFRCLQCIILFTSNNVLLILLSGVFEGVHNAFISGSLESWLLSKSKNLNYDQLWGTNKMCTSSCSFIFMLVVSFIVKDARTCILICLVAYIIFASTNFLYLSDSKDKSSSIKSIMNSSFNFIKQKEAKFSLATLVSFYGIISVYMLLFQAKAIEVGLSDSLLLFSSLLSLLCGIIAGWIFTKMSKINKKGLLMLVSLCGITISFALFAIASNNTTLILGNMIYGFSQAVMFPFFYSELFGILPDESIASNISVISAIASIFAAIATYILGIISDLVSLNAIAYIGVLFGFFSIALVRYLFLGKTNINSQQKEAIK